jgi:hypothetical protein
MYPDKKPTDLDEARKLIEELKKHIAEITTKIEDVANVWGIDVYVNGRTYVPAEVDDSVWKASDSDNLDFYWSESNQGHWISSSEKC